MKSGYARTVFSASILATFLFSVSAGAQQAANRILRVKRIQGQKVTTPEYEVRRNTQGKGVTKQWFRITAIYETAPEWTDQLDFTYYALVKPKKGPQRYLLFRGQVSYVNIKKGTHMSQVYLHPNTIDRFGDVDRVALLIRSKGQLLAMVSEPSSQQRWWEQLQPVDGLLLNRMETPFAMINFDNFEAIKAGPPR